MTDWIPMSNPPKEDGEYLVSFHNKTLDWVKLVSYSKNLYKVSDYEFHDKKRAGWYDLDSEIGYYELTSRDMVGWMPCPAPLKIGEE